MPFETKTFDPFVLSFQTSGHRKLPEEKPQCQRRYSSPLSPLYLSVEQLFWTGYRFEKLKVETFFKDDSNHDPFWSFESIIGARMRFNGLLVEEKHVLQMEKITELVFELLERGECAVVHSQTCLTAHVLSVSLANG